MSSKSKKCFTILTTFIVLSLLLSIGRLPMVMAAGELPENERVTSHLSAYSVYASETEVILYMNNFSGPSVPTATWRGPGGGIISATCSGSPIIVRNYIYSGGMLVETRDHFYISACNREPGSYQVTVSALSVDESFTIIGFKSYFPLVFK